VTTVSVRHLKLLAGVGELRFYRFDFLLTQRRMQTLYFALVLPEHFLEQRARRFWAGVSRFAFTL
jgi:hypothetical protein